MISAPAPKALPPPAPRQAHTAPAPRSRGATGRGTHYCPPPPSAARPWARWQQDKGRWSSWTGHPQEEPLVTMEMEHSILDSNCLLQLRMPRGESTEREGKVEEAKMPTADNELNFHFHSPYAQQKLKNIACLWERQPSGCVRISCAFHHSKPRYINGLFLPPTNNAPLPQGDREVILPPAQCQGSLTSPENILRPIHPPMVNNVSDEENDEEDSVEDNEEIYVSDWVPKTAEDIEEERAIKDICYKSGDSNTIPPELIPTSREGKTTGRRVPKESISRTGCRSFGNGDSYTAEPSAQPGYQPKGHWKDGENNSLPNVREPGRKTYFHSSEPRRSAYVVYRTVTVTQEPKFSRPRAVPEPSVQKCSKGKNEPGKNRRFWTQTGNYDVSDWVPKTAEDIEEERAIKDICYKSGEFYGIQQPDQQQSPSPVSPSQETELQPLEATQWDLQKGNHTAEPKLQPSNQPKGHCKDVENNSSLYYEKETGRKTSFYYSEPQTSAYVVNQIVTVTKEPKFSRPRVPEPSVQKCSKGKNEPGKNRRFWTQTGNYDKHTSGSYNAPTSRKRNPQAKTTIQHQEDMEVNRKGKRYEDRREMKKGAHDTDVSQKVEIADSQLGENEACF
ncbi:uncharacterized protein C12orf50 homolog [Neopsephotus bourkii]|uniref:uncharacterized protein C12orf50 homolog n=1 Tax=Neopsephotus bourkii TaxID=309878 RepID=UPI002AA53D6B|nr:uncharacterized protein C12orf50 homolog [Neopsephotus bourkii]